MVPSIEYQWPLTYNVNGHIFVDYLMVSRSLELFTFAKAPYAIGVDIDLHSEERQVARLTLSSGSEGFRFLFTLGLPQRISDRQKWQ